MLCIRHNTPLEHFIKQLFLLVLLHCAHSATPDSSLNHGQRFKEEDQQKLPHLVKELVLRLLSQNSPPVTLYTLTPYNSNPPSVTHIASSPHGALPLSPLTLPQSRIPSSATSPPKESPLKPSPSLYPSHQKIDLHRFL